MRVLPLHFDIRVPPFLQNVRIPPFLTKRRTLTCSIGALVWLIPLLVVVLASPGAAPAPVAEVLVWIIGLVLPLAIVFVGYLLGDEDWPEPDEARRIEPY